MGTECAKLLRQNYGNENVILSDIIKPTEENLENGPFIFADILDFKGLQKIVVDYRIDWLIHFSALLSAVGEQNVPLAVRVNIEGKRDKNCSNFTGVRGTIEEYPKRRIDSDIA